MRGADLEPAYVLHTRAYRDTSVLLEAFGREHGRLGLVARGARAPRSRRAGLLQAFQPLRLSWRARAELGTLTGVEASAARWVLPGFRLASGFYLNELMLRVLEREDPHVALFDAYALTLERLAGGAPEAPVLRRFEHELLQALGYGLVLREDSAGEPVRADRHYRVHPEAAPHAAEAESGQVPGAALLALAEGVPDAASARSLRGLLRAALAPHIGPRALRSRELYRQGRSGQKPPPSERSRDDGND